MLCVAFRIRGLVGFFLCLGDEKMKKNLFVFVALILAALGLAVASCNDGGDVSHTKKIQKIDTGEPELVDMSGVPIFDNFEDLFSYMIFPCETGAGSAQRILDEKEIPREVGDNSQRQEFLRCFYNAGVEAFAIHTCGLMIGCRVRFKGINNCGTELYNMKKEVMNPDQEDDSYSQGDEQIKKVCSKLYPYQADIYRAPHLAYGLGEPYARKNSQESDTTEDSSEDEGTGEENQDDDHDDQKDDHSDMDPE